MTSALVDTAFTRRKMDQGPFICKCGQVFKNRRYLTEHIGIANPHWPRVSEDDQHKRIFPNKP